MNDKPTGLTPAQVGQPEKREIVRQAAVYASGVLNMAGHPAMQQLVEQVAQEFHVRIAAISIIDRDRQWFPACVGLSVDETTREVSFCARAIENPQDILTVLDARCDPHFASNQLVTGEPFIRFYMGCPIIDRSGRALGSLCVIDPEPRERVDPAERARLRELAQEASRIISHFEVSTGDRKVAHDTIGSQIEDLVRGGDESAVDELDAMLRRMERQEDRQRHRKP